GVGVLVEGRSRYQHVGVLKGELGVDAVDVVADRLEPVVEGEGSDLVVARAGVVVVPAGAGGCDDEDHHQDGEHRDEDRDRGDVGAPHAGGRPGPESARIAWHSPPTSQRSAPTGPSEYQARSNPAAAGPSRADSSGSPPAWASSSGVVHAGCTGSLPRCTRLTRALRKARRMASRNSPRSEAASAPAHSASASASTGTDPGPTVGSRPEAITWRTRQMAKATTTARMRAATRMTHRGPRVPTTLLRKLPMSSSSCWAQSEGGG